MASPTRFTDPVAVDTWDAHFRWRVGDALRDRRIDDTWVRVAGSTAAADGTQAGLWSRRYADAFSDWRLLPDERLLRKAGTGVAIERFDRPSATLNAGAFVHHPNTPKAFFDYDRFTTTAALAVRFLDDAALVAGGSGLAPASLRIGMMGVADALAMLGVRYASDDARRKASEVAVALATGALQGNIELARERGACISNLSKDWAATWRRRGISEALISDALLRGVRYSTLTAIDRHPKLALLANNASDALDPGTVQDFDPASPGISSQSHGEAGDFIAQIELRAAVQPWIDAAIDYPLLFRGDAPDEGTLETCRQRACDCGLGDLSFRSASTPVPLARGERH